MPKNDDEMLDVFATAAFVPFLTQEITAGGTCGAAGLFGGARHGQGTRESKTGGAIASGTAPKTVGLEI
jgi:hypothetical protein